MKKILIVILFCAFVTSTYAQKKLIPVKKSTVTGIDLPNGSKQDGRLLSQSMAGFLMDTESDKRKTTLRTAEVLILPPASLSKFNIDSLVQKLSSQNWKIVATEGDNYLWIQKDKGFVIAYFSIETKGSNLYFAETTSTPDFSAQAENITSNQPATQPVIPPATQSINQPAQNSNANTTTDTSFIGTWGKSGGATQQYGDPVSYGNAGYTKDQYTFNNNGTYGFVSKTYRSSYDKIILVKENGTYQVSGNNLTIIPQKSVIELWSKKDGTDKFGKLVTSDNRPLEKITYQFTKHYFSGIQQWNLVLQADKVTQREGPFSNNTTYSNAWYFAPISANNPVIDLPVMTTEPVQQSTITINSPIIGTWRRGTGGSNYGGRWSSTGYQYTFNTNGTYTYVIKTYVEDDPETLLTRESGTFAISANTITLDPKTNVIEAWSKSNGGDNYKARITRQNKPLEKITYQFTLHHFPEIKETSLVLIYSKETIRDGKYNASDAFPTGWRFSPAGPEYKPIPLPGDLQTTTEEVKKEPAQQNAPIANGKFAFSTTNFDDGWVSTVQEDWVEVKKGSMQVLLHYPKEGTIFPADPGPMTNAAWDILVAPRYSNLKNYKTTYIATFERPYLGMGYATENVTGKNVFIVFFHRGQTGWLEFIAPDKNTFIQHYKFDPETIQWDSNTDLMIPLANMIGYNKFAVAASDLTGKWTSDFTGIQQLYNVYTGQYAGMNINQSNEEFIFNSGNSYSWKLLAVNGVIGNVKAIEVKSSGQFNVPNNWQIYFSKIESSPRTFHAFWSCIKGARLLNLLDANAPGSGIYTKYGLAK